MKAKSYVEIACALLDVEMLPLATPRWATDKTPVHYPGGLTDDDEDELQYRVCRLTGLLPDRWPELDERQRLVSMRLALDAKQAAPHETLFTLLNRRSKNSVDGVEKQPETPIPTPPKRRGRKKADYATVKKEKELADRWGLARDNGTLKRDFAKDNKMTVVDLDRLLDRVAKRKRPSE